MNVVNENKILRVGKNLKSNITLIPVADNLRFDVTANYSIKDFEGNILLVESETFLIDNLTYFVKEFQVNNLNPGKYVLSLELIYPDGVAISSSQFEVRNRKNKLLEIYYYLIGKVIDFWNYILDCL